MSEERIMTLNPVPEKAGTNIDRAKYELIRESIINSIQESGVLTFKQLQKEVHKDLDGRFEGSISWYVTTVKLDLEARGIIERVPSSSPQQLRIKYLPS
ncbi:MAG: hypothetical protein GTO18_07155 [Anaerolineales bacterium]|nr:hypothetical protein [Anaerolineales bacterium]